jgi:hypothetical protein
MNRTLHVGQPSLSWLAEGLHRDQSTPHAHILSRFMTRSGLSMGAVLAVLALGGCGAGSKPATTAVRTPASSATLGGVNDPARAAVGITADGRLMWAGGENLTVSALVQSMLGAHVVRAVKLDINPEWVAAYFYDHRTGHGPPSPVQALPGQTGIPGQFLTPWQRDFFTIVAR